MDPGPGRKELGRVLYIDAEASLNQEGLSGVCSSGRTLSLGSYILCGYVTSIEVTDAG